MRICQAITLQISLARPRPVVYPIPYTAYAGGVQGLPARAPETHARPLTAPHAFQKHYGLASTTMTSTLSGGTVWLK